MRRIKDKTLVLTHSYEAHQVVHWTKAVCMWVQDLVDVIAEYDELVRSPSTTIKKPSIVRLRNNHTVRRTLHYSKAAIWHRDNHQCQYCGVKIDYRTRSIDHIVPRRRGGRNTFTNTVACCKPCNQAKRDRTPDEAGMLLLSKPKKPTSLPPGITLIEHARMMPDEWKAYMPALGE